MVPRNYNRALHIFSDRFLLNGAKVDIQTSLESFIVVNRRAMTMPYEGVK